MAVNLMLGLIDSNTTLR